MSEVTIRLESTLTVSLQKIHPGTFVRQPVISSMTTSPSTNYTSTDNILAYRHSYQDVHGSGLATIFINLGALYPCVTHSDHISCKLFPSEDDGFRSGRAIFEAGDGDGDFNVFSAGNSPVFAFAVEGCSVLTSTCTSIPSTYATDLVLVCLLPRSRCSNAL